MDGAALSFRLLMRFPAVLNLDSVKDTQVGVDLKHPPISPLSLWERVRVRGFSPRRQ